MFAIIETGGKQYKITPNTILDIEKLDSQKGDKVTFDKVLLLSDGDKVEIGNPYLKDFTLEAEVTEQKKDKKIRILRFKAKSRYRRAQGHRQSLTSVKFSDLKTKATTKPKTSAKKVTKPTSKTKAAK